MYKIRLENYYKSATDPVNLIIEGCPSSGLAAIDFRTAHGLPPEPSNVIAVPPIVVTDERFVRAYDNVADGDADILLNSFVQHRYEAVTRNKSSYSNGKELHSTEFSIVASRSGSMRQSLSLFASPESIRAYLAEHATRTLMSGDIAALALVRDILNDNDRTRVKAEEEMAQAKEGYSRLVIGKANARVLLAWEIKQLEDEIVSLKQQNANLEKELEACEREEADGDQD